MCPSRLVYAFWWCLVLPGVFQHLGYLLALASQTFSNMDSLKGSNLGGSVDLFCPSVLLMFHPPNYSEIYCCCPLVWWLCRDILVPSSLFISGNLQNSQNYYLVTEWMSQELISLTLVIFILWRRRCLGVASLISDRLTQMAVFPCFLWGKRY